MADSPEELLPSPPFQRIPGLPNFRDLGGYPISSSGSGEEEADKMAKKRKMVRRNLIFRSSEPSRLTPDGVAQLQALGIANVYDLRSALEINRGLLKEGHRFPVKEWEGARRVFVPVFLDEDYSPEALAVRYRNYLSESAQLAQGFIQAYSDMLTAAAEPSNSYQPFKTILSHLSSSPKANANANATSPSTSAPSSSSSPAATTPPAPSPCLIHCTAGKDRTGLICALILSLCGVADDVVAHEYSLTDLGLRSRHPELVALIMANPELGADPQSARRMVGAQKEAMLGTLARIRETYGSVEKCVLDLGLLSPEGISQLRSNLIVDADENEVVPWQDHAKLLL
ncbi:protein-tyrosine phosphatase-like protein [Whalleya microplaca]|nr:protein-tyrosine phosphatase-like protein [Whalleya microplaca]